MQPVTNKQIDTGQNEPNFKECQTEIKTKDITQCKFYQMRVQEPFFQAIAPFVHSHTKAEIFDKEFVYSPKNSVMQSICAHYQKKYGIQIELIPSTDFAARWEELKKGEEPRFLGLLLRHPDKHFGHVCPLLCYFAKGRAECYIMDVINQKFTFRVLDESVEEALQRAGATYQNRAKTDRQADTDSCRLGAVTLLRNALLWIKKFGAGESLQSLLAKMEIEKTEFNLPLEWSYTEQIYPKKGNLDKMYVIRDFYSTKKKAPRTIAQFREAHTKPGTFECTLFLSSQTKIPVEVPDDIAVNFLKRQCDVSFSATIPGLNRYLVEKGAKMRTKDF